MQRYPGIWTAIVFLLLAQPAFGQGMDLSKAEKFFKGKTITWMIGSTPGGSVDRLSGNISLS